MIRNTYQAKTYGPIFYSSIEGGLIKTDKFISSTALSYALGYKLNLLKKYYILTGEEARKPNYSPLKKLPFFASDLKPLDVSTEDRTFKSTSYTEDYNITTTESDVAKQLNNDSKYAFPDVKNKSQAGWQELRYYTGISPGSTYRFTIWSEEEMPDKLRFELGMKRTGNVVAHKTPEPETVDLNQYLLEKVYDVPKNKIMNLMNNGAKYYPATEPRISRFSEIDIKEADELISKYELYKQISN